MSGADCKRATAPLAPAQRAAKPLAPDFFDRSVHAVARELIGYELHFGDSGGIIVETESYEEADPACHAHVGLTKRTAVLFGPPGRAYVYFSYGIHSLVNFVCEPEGEAAAVLIRALEPTVGVEEMRRRRGPKHADTELCNGPGKLTEALGITLAENGSDLALPPWAILPPAGAAPKVVTGPRIGITKATERPWRFSAAGSRFVSRPKPPADAEAGTRDRRS